MNGNQTQYTITPMVPGVRPADPPNYDGITFVYVFCTILDPWIMPVDGTQVTVVVDNAQGFTGGMTVFIENAGYMEVVGTTALDRMTLSTLGPGYAQSAGSSIFPGKVTTTSLPGPIGLTGVPGQIGPQGVQGNPGPPLNPKGVVATASSLPSSGNLPGDLYVATDTGHGWSWNGSGWVDLGMYRGATGPAGPQGVTGNIGPQGVQGVQGTQGIQGPTGNTGATGSTGPQGALGPTGPQGPVGPPGGTTANTTLTATFTMPASGANATASVTNASVFAQGAVVFIPPLGYLSVQSVNAGLNQLTLQNLGYSTNQGSGNTAASGATVSGSGPIGPTGATGSTGSTGAAGSAATIAVGSVTTGSPGTGATVVNAGTSAAAVFNFTIPSGLTGAAGSQGIQGSTGAQGPTGPQGPAGTTGAAATVAVGTTSTLAPNQPATVSNSGSLSAAVLNFGVPQGLTGATGPQGPPGATVVSANLNNKATLGSDNFVLVQGTAPGLAATLHSQTVSGDDPQLTNARVPTAHAPTHITGGSDIIASVAATSSGLVPSPASTAQRGLRTNSSGVPSWRPLEFFSLIDFGADPTGASDSTSAINAAIAAAPAGSLIWVPAGTYNISSSIVVTKPLYFRGPSCSTSGSGYAQFVGTTATVILFDIQSNNACTFENLFFYRSTTPTTGYGMRVNGTTVGTTENNQSQWINCNFGNHYIGLYFAAALSWTCDRCAFICNVASTYGVYIDETVSSSNGGNSFVACNFFGNHFSGTVGIYQVAASDILITGCKFYDHDYSIFQQLRTGGSCFGLIVTGCTLGDYAVGGIYVNNTNATNLYDVLITGNEFSGKPSSNSNCITINNTSSGTIGYFNISGNVLLITGTSNGIICLGTGNTVDGVIAANVIICQVSTGQPISLAAATGRINVSANHMAGSSNRIANASATNLLFDDEGTLTANIASAAAPGSKIYCTDIKGVGDTGYTPMMVAASGGTGAWLHRKGTTWYAL